MKNSMLTLIGVSICFTASSVLFFADDKLYFPTMLVGVINLGIWVVERINETKNDK